MKRRKASYTVEAVYIIPIVLLLIASMFRISMQFCDTTRGAAQDSAAVQELDTLDYFIKGSELDSIKGLLGLKQ